MCKRYNTRSVICQQTGGSFSFSGPSEKSDDLMKMALNVEGSDSCAHMVQKENIKSLMLDQYSVLITQNVKRVLILTNSLTIHGELDLRSNLST